MTAYDLINHHSRAKQMAIAAELYADLKALADEHPTEIALRVRQAKAVNNLVFFYAEANEYQSAKEFFRNLEQLSGSIEIKSELEQQGIDIRTNLAELKKLINSSPENLEKT